MHIIGMKIADIPPFTDRVEFELDEHVNVFIGPNATGKSTLMYVARLLLTQQSMSQQDEELYWFCRVSHSSDWPLVKDRPYDASDPDNVEVHREHVEHFGNHYDVEACPIISVPSTRLGSNLQTRRREPGAFLAGSAWSYRPDHPTVPASVKELLDPSHGQGWSVLYAEAIEHATRLMRERARELNAASVKENVYRAIALAQICAHQICNEVLAASDVPWHRTIATNADQSDDYREYTEYYSLTSVRHAHSRLPIHVLSAGTETTVWWIRFITLNMAYHYGFVDGWEKQPAILLIDEIENHLHPTWQRRVIPALLEHFPGLQIFATTHSPFVVAGLKKGQVHLLKRDADGVVTATTNTEDIVGWTADEILRTMMGVDDPTDEATAAAARELRQLRSEGTRDTEDAEAARQTRMQELRRLVDRDLLAGGPAAAQEELFEQQFAEALEKYLRARDLSQENG